MLAVKTTIIIIIRIITGHVFVIAVPAVHRMTNIFIVTIFSSTGGSLVRCSRYAGIAAPLFFTSLKIPERNHNGFSRPCENKRDIKLPPALFYHAVAIFSVLQIIPLFPLSPNNVIHELMTLTRTSFFLFYILRKRGG